MHIRSGLQYFGGVSATAPVSRPHSLCSQMQNSPDADRGRHSLVHRGRCKARGAVFSRTLMSFVHVVRRLIGQIPARVACNILYADEMSSVWCIWWRRRESHPRPLGKRLPKRRICTPPKPLSKLERGAGIEPAYAVLRTAP